MTLVPDGNAPLSNASSTDQQRSHISPKNVQTTASKEVQTTASKGVQTTELPATVLALLSKQGRAACWPSRGILQQASEAQQTAINATIGIALDDAGKPLVLDAMRERVALPPEEVFPYASGFGLPELRRAWRDSLIEKNPSLATVPGEQYTLPVVTAGLTHALSIVGTLFLDEGETIILPDLFWGNYRLIFVQGRGARLETFPLFRDGAFNLNGLRAGLQHWLQHAGSRGEGGARGGKVVLLLNFPNNPTGYSPTLEEAEGILAVIKEVAERGVRVLVILDDAYFGLVYEEGVLRESLFGRLAALHENVLVAKVDGASKEEFSWGLRVGFLTIGGRALDTASCRIIEEKIAGTVRATVSNVARLSQQLVLEALRDPRHEEEKKEKYQLLKKRYEETRVLIKQFGLKALPYNSGYFFCLSLDTSRERDTERVRQELREKGVGVIGIPGDLLRVAYSSVSTAALPELFEKIAEATRK